MRTTIEAIVRKRCKKEVEAYKDLKQKRGVLEAELRRLGEKAKAAQVEVGTLEPAIDKQVLEGKDPKKLIETAMAKLQEVKTYNKRTELLTSDLALCDLDIRDAAAALSKAMYSALVEYRDELGRERIRPLLDQALKTMCAFETEALALFSGLRLPLDPQKERSLGRFLELESLVEDLEPYCASMGSTDSFLKRRDFRRKLQATA